MYRINSVAKNKVSNFDLQAITQLDEENRWVKLAELIPWSELETEYARQFSKKMGAPAKPFRMALGALIIKEHLGTSDRETVERIKESPYLQYFLGLPGFSKQAPFEASMFVHFRKRLNLELVGRINERIVLNLRQAEQNTSPEEGPAEDQSKVTAERESELPQNQGQLILDASCAPADINYPTDLKLLNQAREQTEKLIDQLYEQVRPKLGKKPRTYRRIARKDYLELAAQRRPKRKKLRQAIRKQLSYLRRNLAHIDALVDAGASLSELNQQNYCLLLVVSELFRQQQWMYENKTNRIDDRIVSLTQPHLRPIVRGKAGTPVEFGAKISVSYSDGYCFLDHLSWDNFNESLYLESQVDKYYQRFGCYPESLHVDQIYRTRANRAWCKKRGIRLSGPPLGRRPTNRSPELIQQQREDERYRNAIEGKFGQAKRRYGLGRVMAKLSETAESSIAITFLVMNLEQLLKQLLMLFFCFVCNRRQLKES
ncbi:MAG: IS5 family transposase [Xenococcus sp. MO_188.B8]|nr:IS5 family transposase [Xenococcus sp. MO_188.B8]